MCVAALCIMIPGVLYRTSTRRGKMFSIPAIAGGHMLRMGDMRHRTIVWCWGEGGVKHETDQHLQPSERIRKS